MSSSKRNRCQSKKAGSVLEGAGNEEGGEEQEGTRNLNLFFSYSDKKKIPQRP